MQAKYNLRIDFEFSVEAKMELRMWRGWLYLQSVNTELYARPFDTFRTRRPKYVITTDYHL
jgi:hypothetical protein